ncbi:MAG: GNAT superfamily N-acetyltransferase [Saprospiraceae bacterium]|jgi:GNAT superfamily N-acetyltransferase
MINHLGNTDFDTLLDCFLLAFENYFVKMPTDRNYYKERWIAAKVDYKFSYGMFLGGNLVGFIIHAVDHKEGRMAAYNTGTGVVPEYRGQKIVKALYEYAIEDLKKNEIECCTLEVITENEIALKSYLSIGFEIQKTYKCFGGKIHLDKSWDVTLKEKAFEKVNWLQLPNQEFYSWDNRKESIQNPNYKFYEVYFECELESFFIINTENHYLAQFDLLQERPFAWERLFVGIHQLSEPIRTNNVDDRLTAKVNIINKVGLDNSVDQYEMKLEL